jgi:Flp pilus assembly protein CpaB
MFRKLNPILLITGLVLVVVAVGGTFLAGRLLNPPPARIPVALADLPAGTRLDPAQFRLEQWHGLRPETLRALHQADDFPADALTLADVPAGSPLYRAYVDTDASHAFVTRLTHLVRDRDQVVVAIPVSPDTGGNIPRPGDEVDLVLSLGALRADAVERAAPTPTPALPSMGAPALAPRAATPTPEAVSLPLATLVLANVPVLQVEYQQLTTSSGGIGGELQTQTSQGPAERLYVAVTREQAEVLAFLLHTGDVLLAVHPPGLGASYPGGIGWEDFAARFFAHRPTPAAPTTQPTATPTGEQDG